MTTKSVPCKVSQCVVLCFALIFASNVSRAELPPGSYDSLRANASEAVVIVVESVKSKPNAAGDRKVTVIARVARVERSASKLAKNDKIVIVYEVRGTPIPGPRPTPMLEQNETYTAFLKPTGETNIFSPAAHGESFNMTPEKRD